LWTGTTTEITAAIVAIGRGAEGWLPAYDPATVPPLLSIEAALESVLAHVRPLPAERISVWEAAGRVLAEPARARVDRVDLPPFPSSAMDGFAVRAADTPGRLPTVARIAAGAPAAGPLGTREAMAIATGGVVPEDADAVIPIEYVVEHGNEVEVPEAVAVGANVRPRGGDVHEGDVVVPAGARLGPAQLGALAAAGVDAVVCGGRPRASVVVTGSELRSPGDALGPGQVYEANGILLRAALAAAGAETGEGASVPDDADLHRDALARGLDGDVLLTSGGVSVGPHDLVRGVGRELGVDEVFWGVAVKPGKPVWFGVRGGSLVFGLPGNPVSSLVGFELFVKPAVLALQGCAVPGPEYLPGRLARAVRLNPAREQLVRARSRAVAEGVELEPLSGQESHMIARAAAADTLVRIPLGDGELAAGAPVRYLRLG
jgi:molybdopterin molybdotransferase